MRLLVVTPDYLSHYLPLNAIAARAARAGIDVVVASGPGLRPRVMSDGHRWTELRMSAGSNAGLRPVVQLGDDLRPFFAATARGMVPTLRHQADRRRHDLLWQPRQVAEETIRIVEREAPHAVLVDHLCVAARLGLYAAGVPATTFVPGHPSQLPVAGEVYGFPVAWPRWVHPTTVELDELRGRCIEISAELAAEATAVVQALAPNRAPVSDVFGALDAGVLYNSPAGLRDGGRVGLPDPHRFLGGCVRPASALEPDIARWVADGGPFVYVSLGTFLSARADVLRRVAAALASGGRRVAMATGSTDPNLLGPLPRTWLLRPFLPQVELVASAEAVVCHGGNNTVNEALAAGKPLVVLPLSTDQFCIAVDVERAGVGLSADPNRTSVAGLAERMTVLDDPSVRSVASRHRPGPRHRGRSRSGRDRPRRAAGVMPAGDGWARRTSWQRGPLRKKSPESLRSGRVAAHTTDAALSRSHRSLSPSCSALCEPARSRRSRCGMLAAAQQAGRAG